MLVNYKPLNYSQSTALELHIRNIVHKFQLKLRSE